MSTIAHLIENQYYYTKNLKVYKKVNNKFEEVTSGELSNISNKPNDFEYHINNNTFNSTIQYIGYETILDQSYAKIKIGDSDIYYISYTKLTQSINLSSSSIIKNIDIGETYLIDSTKNKDNNRIAIENIKENADYNVDISDNNVLIPYNQNTSTDTKIIRSKLNELLNDTYGNIIPD